LEEQLVVLQLQLLFDLNGNLHTLIFHLLHGDLSSFVVQKLDMLMLLEYKIQMSLQQSLKQIKDF
jgi:hypothetical protein